jgi:hypothetical protein
MESPSFRVSQHCSVGTKLRDQIRLVFGSPNRNLPFCPIVLMDGTMNGYVGADTWAWGSFRRPQVIFTFLSDLVERAAEGRQLG